MKAHIFSSILIVFLVSLNGLFAQKDTIHHTTMCHYVAFSPITDSCLLLDDYPISLSIFVTPVGGTFTGKGVVAGKWFDPKKAGVGEHLITYNYYGWEETITVKVKDPKVIY